MLISTQHASPSVGTLMWSLRITVLFSRVLHGCPSVQGAFFLSKTLLSGSVWFYETGNLTVAVLRYRESYGEVYKTWGVLRTVQGGFQKSGILRCASVRFAYIVNSTDSAVRCCDTTYGLGRRGSPLIVFFYGAVPIPVGKTVQCRFFCTVQLMNQPYKTAVS